MAGLLNFRLTLEDLLGPKLAALAAKVEQFGRKVEDPHKVKVDTSQAEGGLSKLTGLVGRAAAAFGIFEAAKGIVKMGSDLEQTRIQFETFTGSAEKGNKVIADLQKFAQVTPFEDEQVISAGRQLLAFGENAESLNPILTKLGNISSATGKDFNELVSLWGKNKLSGIIQGEDLNQLVDSGIPVMDSLARQLGVTTAQVRKMGADGKISFAMLDKAFDELGGAGGKWGALMDKQSKTVAGRWSSLVGFAQNLGGKLGEAINPFLGVLVDSGAAVLQFVQANTGKIMEMFQPLADAFQPLFDAFDVIAAQLGLTGDGTGYLTAAFTVLATIIQYLAPVIKIAATFIGQVWQQLAKVVGVVWRFIETSPRLQKFFSGLWSAAVATFKGIAEAATKFLGGLGGIIEGVFTGDFGKIKKGLADTFNALGDVGADKLGGKAADGFVDGYKKGFQKSNIFDIKAAGTGKSNDAATDFLSKGAKPPTGALAPGLSAATKAGAAGAAGSSSKITHITLRNDAIMKDVKIYAGSGDEAGEQIAQMVIKKIMAQLNDVNTIASN